MLSIYRIILASRVPTYAQERPLSLIGNMTILAPSIPLQKDRDGIVDRPTARWLHARLNLLIFIIFLFI